MAESLQASMVWPCNGERYKRRAVRSSDVECNSGYRRPMCSGDRHHSPVSRQSPFPCACTKFATVLRRFQSLWLELRRHARHLYAGGIQSSLAASAADASPAAARLERHLV